MLLALTRLRATSSRGRDETTLRDTIVNMSSNYRGGGRSVHELGRIRYLRRTTAEAEGKLWHRIRNGQLQGLKFRRQHPFGPFTLDFYCADKHLAVEVDGSQHLTPEGEASDARRTKYLMDHGVKVIRFSNIDVISELDGVLLAILEAAGMPFNNEP